ncbi:hypothetical protein BLNAU_13459 [Blattamonas nauphoetae]|uniref:Uncharacterized protein n=1 Tax=Blattamonas nauphoetae TaxID=2049346 RepID=A0ABQ9XJD9_9EUKA|nr:hypothetical protein BLNAU_13459 [Blattamonas nauphoetae]
MADDVRDSMRNEAFDLCSSIINNLGADYRLVRQAVQGLVFLSGTTPYITCAKVVKLLLFVIQGDENFRSHPRRYAIRSLSRIERMRPANMFARPHFVDSVELDEGIQNILRKLNLYSNDFTRHVNFSQSSLQNHSTKKSNIWAILIGAGRMAQADTNVRLRWFPRWLEACRSRHYRTRWAGIKGLGHSSCSIGDIMNDALVEEHCLVASMNILKDGGEDWWRVYMERKRLRRWQEDQLNHPRFDHQHPPLDIVGEKRMKTDIDPPPIPTSKPARPMNFLPSLPTFISQPKIEPPKTEPTSALSDDVDDYWMKMLVSDDLADGLVALPPPVPHRPPTPPSRPPQHTAATSPVPLMKDEETSVGVEGGRDIDSNTATSKDSSNLFPDELVKLSAFIDSLPTDPSPPPSSSPLPHFPLTLLSPHPSNSITSFPQTEFVDLEVEGKPYEGEMEEHPRLTLSPVTIEYSSSIQQPTQKADTNESESSKSESEPDLLPLDTSPMKDEGDGREDGEVEDTSSTTLASAPLPPPPTKARNFNILPALPVFVNGLPTPKDLKEDTPTQHTSAVSPTASPTTQTQHNMPTPDEGHKHTSPEPSLPQPLTPPPSLSPTQHQPNITDSPTHHAPTRNPASRSSFQSSRDHPLPRSRHYPPFPHVTSQNLFPLNINNHRRMSELLMFDADLLPDSYEANVSLSRIRRFSSEFGHLWGRDKTYLVQYGAAQALSLLLRSNPDRWWPRLTEVFAFFIADKNVAAMVKVSVILCYGKLSFYLDKDNPYLQPIHKLLVELSQSRDTVISEPASYALVYFALSHKYTYSSTFALYGKQFAAPLRDTPENVLSLHLKSWCKLISGSHRPVLNVCASVQCINKTGLCLIPHPGERVGRKELEWRQKSDCEDDDKAKKPPLLSQPYPTTTPPPPLYQQAPRPQQHYQTYPQPQYPPAHPQQLYGQRPDQFRVSVPTQQPYPNYQPPQQYVPQQNYPPQYQQHFPPQYNQQQPSYTRNPHFRAQSFQPQYYPPPQYQNPNQRHDYNGYY